MNLFVAVFLSPWLLIDKYPRATGWVLFIGLIVSICIALVHR